MSLSSLDFPLFVQERMDARVTVKVPATPSKKAYEYTKNTSGVSTPKAKGMSGGQKAAIALNVVGLGLGAAAIALTVKHQRDRAEQAKVVNQQVNSVSEMADRIGNRYKGPSEEQKQKDAEAAKRMGSRFGDALKAERDIYYSKEKKEPQPKRKGDREKSAAPMDDDFDDTLSKTFSSDRASKFKPKPAPEPKKSSRSVATTVDQSGKKESDKDYKVVLKSAKAK